MTFLYYLQSLLARALVASAGRLPLNALEWITRRAGDLSCLFMPKRRGVAAANIDKAFGSSLSDAQKKNLVRAAFQHAALSIAELFLVRRIAARAREHFSLMGNEVLEKAFARGNGVVLVISHIGSWEYLSFLPFLTGQRWSVVVKHIKNPFMNREIDALRRVMTVTPILKNNSTRKVLQELKEDHGVAILIDQWAGPEGIWSPLFGAETSTTSIPARLAKRTGCALVPAYCVRTAPWKYEIQIHPEVPVQEPEGDWETATTRELDRLLERQILKYPEQWMWGHRRWKDKPSSLRA
ncbi:MAG TPA: lysophospholipid acyltransferase family protein [Verrucomicrobiae bacterium]|nr:lysophospholipid acyltransferase family protein [Verrucomicrobiae bacterium]